jgi:hypothetical protein
MDQITDLVFVGTRVLSTKLSSTKLSLSAAQTKSMSRRDSAMLTATREIKNAEAFKLFHDYFLECVTQQLLASLTLTTQALVVEEFHLLSHLLQAAGSAAPPVREAILNLLVFVVTSGINDIAFQELVGLSCLL